MPNPSEQHAEHEDGRIASVSYLPGARPTSAAERARGAVETAYRESGADRDEHGRGGSHGRQPRGRAGAADRGDRAAESDDRSTPAMRASRVSLDHLARRGMSRWELEGVLRKRELDEQTVQAELERLEAVGLVDDAALAETLVESTFRRKNLGRRAMEQELRRRRIDPVIIEQTLAGRDGEAERDGARKLARERVARLSSVDDDTAARRLSGYLTRKGYDSDTVRQVVREAVSERGGSPRVTFQ